MAEQLVEGMVEEFKPEKYEDEYRRDLMKLIHKKAKAGDVNRVPEVTEAKPHRAAPTNVIDLAALLASSLKGGRGGGASASEGRREKHGPAKSRPHARRRSARTEHHRKSA